MKDIALEGEVDHLTEKTGFAYNLDGRYYSDPAFYERERAQIFRRTWQFIGAAATVAAPGNYLASTVAGYQMFAHRGRDGVLRAFENICPHRGARILATGSGSCDQLRCPYHGWIFDDAGRVTDTPWFGQPSPFDIPSLGLPAISVSEWRGLLFVAVDPETSLIEQLGELPEAVAGLPMESLTPAAGRRFSADVNWKAYLDQFNEFYHVPQIHPPDKTVGIDKYDAYPRQGMMCMTSPEGRASDAAYYGGRWLWSWPNWTVSFFPGGMKTSRINPLSAARCEVEFGFYFADMTPANEGFRDQVINATASIVQEDLGAAGLAQANYASGAYRPGPLHPQLEHAVAYFQARVRQALDGGQTDAAALLRQPG